MMTESQDAGSERSSLWQAIVSCSGTAADRRNQYRFVAWLSGWAVTFLAATWLLETYDDLGRAVAWSVAVVPNLFAVAALFAYLRFLREADELVRRIQLEGLAFGFGAGVIFAMAYFTLKRLGVPQLTGDQMVFVMMMAWVTGQLAATWRYR
jgi:cbb3-type cytochrome oxidase subunit 1